MILKTIQWNIGGGKIRNKNDDPMDPLVYSIDAMKKIIEVLKKYNADIITIQECHSNENEVQAEIIAKELGFKYYVNDIYADSHIEDGQGLSQAVISRFLIENPNLNFFIIPKLKLEVQKESIGFLTKRESQVAL